MEVSWFRIFQLNSVTSHYHSPVSPSSDINKLITDLEKQGCVIQVSLFWDNLHFWKRNECSLSDSAVCISFDLKIYLSIYLKFTGHYLELHWLCLPENQKHVLNGTTKWPYLPKSQMHFLPEKLQPLHTPKNQRGEKKKQGTEHPPNKEKADIGT